MVGGDIVESMEKNLLGIRYYNLSSQFGVDKAKVSRIIRTYISINRAELLSGRIIRFLGLVYIEPDTITSYSISTLALQCKKVADELSLPYQTCLAVVKEYLGYLRSELSCGAVVDIRSIASLHPYYDNGVYKGVQSSISVSIKRDLNELNGVVTSVRVHTCKLLKQSISIGRGVVNS